MILTPSTGLVMISASTRQTSRFLAAMREPSGTSLYVNGEVAAGDFVPAWDAGLPQPHTLSKSAKLRGSIYPIGDGLRQSRRVAWRHEVRTTFVLKELAEPGDCSSQNRHPPCDRAHRDPAR